MSLPFSVGLLGLGIIGSRVAENLRKAGYDVFVWSRSVRDMANFLPTPRAVAEAARVVQIFVRNDEALVEAMADMSPALGAGHIIMNHATVSKGATLKAAEVCSASGAAYLDAPFTGSKMAAQNGKLVYYIGGDAAVLEEARPILAVSSAQILPFGGIGDATVLKIVTNLISAVTVKALTEAAAITRGHGVPLEHLLAALQGNANYSALIGMKLPAMIKGDFEPHFSLRNMLKDADFARGLAAEAGLETPALDAAAAAMRRGVEAGEGDADFSVIGKVV